jgi:hypothetical protein
LRPPAPSRFGTTSAPAGYFRLLIDCLPRPLRAPLNACCRAKPSSLRTAAPAAPRLVVRPGAPPDTQPRLSPMPICPRAYGSAGTGVLRRDADAHARPLALERGRLARRPASACRARRSPSRQVFRRRADRPRSRLRWRPSQRSASARSTAGIRRSRSQCTHQYNALGPHPDEPRRRPNARGRA